MLVNQNLIDRIRQYKLKKQQLREWLQHDNFAMLDKFFLSEQQTWQKNPQYGDDDYFSLIRIENFLLNEHHPTDFLPLLKHLEAWQKNMPNAYHAHLILGIYWVFVAAKIRSSDCGSYVSQAQWQGAAFARDLACIQFLNAIKLTPTPEAALYHLVKIVSYLDEPSWLTALFQGKLPSAYSPPTGEDYCVYDAWQAGLRLLAGFGGALPDLTTCRLPPTLPARLAHEMADGRIYWLHQAIKVSPKNLYLFSNAVYYLYPRWYGDHEQMSAFIDGPLCDSLNEKEKNVLWRMKYLDILESYPNKEDTKEVTEHLALWQDLLGRALFDQTRFLTLLGYAEFLSYLDRTREAYEIYKQAAHLQNQTGMLINYELTHIRNLCHDVLYRITIDSDCVLAFLLSNAALQYIDAESITAVACFKKYSLCGFSSEQSNAEYQQLSSVLRYINPHQGNHAGWAYHLCAVLFKAGFDDAAIWLAKELTSLNVTWSMVFLSDVARGVFSDIKHVDKPANKLTPTLQEAESLVRHASDLGLLAAKYHLAEFFLIKNNYQITDKAIFDEAYRLLTEVWHGGDGDAALPLFRLSIESGDFLTQKKAHQQLTAYLLEYASPQVQGIVAHYLASIYTYGKGSPAYPILGVAWAKTALTFQPDNMLCQKIIRDHEGNFLSAGLNKIKTLASSKQALKTALADGEVFAPPGFEL